MKLLCSAKYKGILEPGVFLAVQHRQYLDKWEPYSHVLSLYGDLAQPIHLGFVQPCTENATRELPDMMSVSEEGGHRIADVMKEVA